MLIKYIRLEILNKGIMYCPPDEKSVLKFS